ncbi:MULTISPECIES: pre-toxin TG domain-containing protein [unclassified Bacillus (in: firmicutes)]|uniref:pre-toxin TG domain-containing protein n=1 Tax=unclassified Bacillus (in: firmicutes) TaxID=185979 RepID=UPI0008ECCF02|nr:MULTISPECIES: pre-toxin TG domain-containing protein [unclassified Bacillus (in: firmicutes)]SFI02091.1 LXG domain of WXG superfamily protein [Bacillus sp. 71mf]SFS91888.1 LXG domain of WXG superfamily protein [Bacillus sp. 103mf]
MSLNMYLGEVQSQTQSMNAMCTATIQGMEQVINSIDAFVFDAVLQGQTYDSAKAFFAQTFRPLAQGIIYLCEELIRQNDAFPNDFQSKVASTDVIEQEIEEQMRGIDQTKAGIEVISNTLPGMQAMMGIFDLMKQKLQEKLNHLREFNSTSSSNYDTAIQLAASITKGLAEVQSGKGFSPVSGTFSTQGLNMEWTGPIQKIAEDRAREADKFVNKDLIGEETVNDETSSESEKKDFDGKKLARDIAGEISGEYDVRRAWEGVDPSTGEKLGTLDRFLAGGMAVAGLTPFGKISKVGKGLKMTAEAARDAERVIEANKITKGSANPTYSSFRDLMSPDEAARYNEYWKDVGTKKAVAGRDSKLAEINAWSNTKRSDVVTVVGGTNLETGEIAVGIKSRKMHAGQPICAEDLVVEQLGVNSDNIIMTNAIRPRNGKNIPVCKRCQTKYPVEQFMKGTEFEK